MQQRQRARLRLRVDQDGGGQRRLNRHARVRRRRANCLFQFGQGQWQNQFCALTHQFGQRRVLQRPVIKIGAQCDYHPQLAARIMHGRQQAVEKMPPRRLIFNQGKQLLELVNEQQERAAFSIRANGQNVLENAPQALVILF